MLGRILVAAAAWALLASGGIAQSACPDARIGINLAGAEFGKMPGRWGSDFRFPTAEQVAYFASLGFSSVRLPLRWERLQTGLMEPLDARYLHGIVAVMDAAAKHGMDVLVDLHNYARYRGQVVGSESVPKEAFFDIWQRIARAVGSHPALHGYGLMNEPFRTNGLWHKVAQAGVDGIRSVDRVHAIYVAGEGFSNTRAWEQMNGAPFVTDPSNLEVYEGHVYFDHDGSGKYAGSDPPAGDAADVARRRIKPFLEWLAKHSRTGAIGEYGVPSDDDRWFPAIDATLQMAAEHCLRTYVWAGGNWSPGYKLSLQPLQGAERRLARHFARHTGAEKRE